MRIFLTSLFLFLFFAIPARWYFVCELRHNCGNEAPKELFRPKTLQLVDGKDTILSGYEQLAFSQNTVLPDLSENNQVFIQKVADYLNKQEDKNIKLIGYFRPSEANETAGMFENIGIARASKIEKLLIQLGIEQSRISLDSKGAKSDTLIKPMSFDLITASMPNEYADLQFRFENMTYSDANFATNSDDFEPGFACLNYLDSLAIYFNQHPEMALIITGHADARGTEADNLKLGENRAKNTKQFIEENYEVDINIETVSMGEKEPVAPNYQPDGLPNEEGMQKNRRVNFRIIQNDIEE